MLEKYQELCQTLLECDYSILTVFDYLKLNKIGRETNHPIAIVRHDVDRKPGNSLMMAELEHAMGIRSSYYFRYPYTFKPEIMRKIQDLGHEIGYHYEVLAKVKGEPKKAIQLFEQELNAMREVSDIKTICMHGSPLSKYNNRDLWKTYDFSEYRIMGEAFNSIQGVLYFTDTGRSWDTRNNIRDKSDHFKQVAGLKRTDDLMNYIQTKRPLSLYLTIHPERWASNTIEFYTDSIQDFTINCGKRIISRVLK